jgi:hypothetical protein
LSINSAIVEELHKNNNKGACMYCIAEFQKVKEARTITTMAGHNFRVNLSQADKERIDTARSPLNEVLVNTLVVNCNKPSDLYAKLSKHWKDKEIQIKKDSVLAIDLVITASPEFFGEWHKNDKLTIEGKKKIDAWKKVQLDFVVKKFGADAVKLFILHLDETTPHIHILLSPEETKTLKYKNQYGLKEKKVSTLNANRWNPVFWKKFVTDHAKANEKFGLKRGKEGSLAKKTTLKEFKNMSKKAVDVNYEKEFSKIYAEIESELNFMNTKAKISEIFAQKLKPTLNGMAKNNQALKILLQDKVKEYALLERLTKEAEVKLADLVKREKSQDIRHTTVNKLNAENAAYKKTLQEQELEIQELKAKLFKPSFSSNQTVFKNRA